MSDEPSLVPVESEDLVFALAFGLQFRSRMAKPQVAGLVAQITASQLVEYLDRSGFVVMRKPTSSTDYPQPGGRHLPSGR